MYTDIFQTKNNQTMLRCVPLNWMRKSHYINTTTAPFYYVIDLNTVSRFISFIFEPRTNVLRIADKAVIEMRVKDIAHASEIVYSVAQEMCHMSYLEQTIYWNTTNPNTKEQHV